MLDLHTYHHHLAQGHNERSRVWAKSQDVGHATYGQHVGNTEHGLGYVEHVICLPRVTICNTQGQGYG